MTAYVKEIGQLKRANPCSRSGCCFFKEEGRPNMLNDPSTLLIRDRLIYNCQSFTLMVDLELIIRLWIYILSVVFSAQTFKIQYRQVLQLLITSRRNTFLLLNFYLAPISPFIIFLFHWFFFFNFPVFPSCYRILSVIFILTFSWGSPSCISLMVSLGFLAIFYFQRVLRANNL